MINILKEKNNKLTKEEVYLFLHKWLKEQIELSNRQTESEESFNKPAWSEFQAYHLGTKRALNKLKEILPDQGKHD